MQTYSLKDLLNLSFQDAFDIVAEHLLFQYEKCEKRDGGCYYRYDGRKCAFGVFISDEEYTGDMEGHNASKILQNYTTLEEFWKMGIFDELQGVHDYHPPKNWAKELDELAEKYALTSCILKETY